MTVCTTCPYCGVGCGVLADADGTVRGDPDHPANRGRLCSKGAALGETIDLDGRLLQPMLQGTPIAWDAATQLMAEKFNTAIRDHGPDSVAFYVSGQLLTEDYYVANKLMKGYIGSANIDTNSRLCMASTVAGHKRAFGTDTVPGNYEDLEQADLIVLVGSNLAWCHPVLFQRIVAAKAARPQMRIVNIDPRQTATSDLADMHLSIRHDGDVALFNALLCHLADVGAVDTAFVASHVSGFDETLTQARMAGETGLQDNDVAEFCKLWGRTEKVVTVFSQGVNQSVGGTDKVNAIINCHLATGRIGRPGMGPFSVTGQPNAMGGREVGGLANMLGWHLDIENQEHRDAVQKGWNSPTICTSAGLKAVELFDACADGRIKALWIMSTNPAVSMPDASAVRDAIANVPFVAVSDIAAQTDTGDLADLLLPATGWGEKNGTVTNSERRISRQRAFLPAPGAARPDWKIICDVAVAMGFDDGFAYDSPAEIFREYAEMSALGSVFGRDFDISGVDTQTADYDEMEPFQWPVLRDVAPKDRFFEDGEFYHADGKARMVPVLPAPGLRVAADQFHLNTGRIRDQWHTMTRSGKSARLSQHLAEPFVEIHPSDAARLGVHPAGLLQLQARSGKAVFRTMLSENIAPGHLFVPMHWTAQLAPEGRSNSLISSTVDPISGQPALKDSAVTAKVFPAAWYGFAVSYTQMLPTRPYAVIARTDTGWQAEVAGMKPPRDWIAEARSVTGITGGHASIVKDPATGMARVAIMENGAILGLFFAGRAPVEVSRRTAIDLIGTQALPLTALAGRAPGNVPDTGAVVCSCFGVGVNALRSEISSGANTVALLGERTCAGTNCGSCRPELAALIAQAGVLPVAAE